MAVSRLQCFTGTLYILWALLKMYAVGTLALVRQILQRHKPAKDLRLHTGKVAIVTGGSGGIGFEVSKGLVAKNVHVFIACKCVAEGRMAIDKIREEFPNAKVDFLELDLSSLVSVNTFVDNFLARGLPLHILINNAGVMFKPYQETEDQMEYHFQVNYLGHLYLTKLLLWKLCESGADNSYSRIINVSSIVQCVGCIDIERLGETCIHWSQYSPHAAYADSKLAIVIATYSLDTKLRRDTSKVSINAVHPGIVNTPLYRHVHWGIKWLLDFVARLTYKTPVQGADGILFLALSDSLEGNSGGYYDNCSKVSSKGISYNTDLQERLLRKSEEILQVIVNRTLYGNQD
ncbi:dehydrogenase/reductase SDR family member on chromosome X-like [Mizuhopecten yessoensis]|uniref:Dehydrogenase/reductase SDR family member on chromosome X n=1 Tax=Mizuhopecten yessoensis TaxID=6573 RepID=A0A210Q4X7_MIZYE|nr:dehydrogenase/reductase SDR family member on chromosome X-like [Mizuhopecten yessoensis]OWF43787.1 Dehydrogenase/reductase SDR family member on chromosome X [Mizuhopecten yessoensis]